MTDPIFAAIAEYMRADRECADGELTVHDWDDPAHVAYRNACEALASTVPTTVAGAAALAALLYEERPSKYGDMGWHDPVIANLATALEGLAAAGGAQ